MGIEKKKAEHLWEIVKQNLGGRPVSFETPKELLEKALEYFQWVEDNPWQEKNASNRFTEANGNKNKAMQQNVKVYRRPYTLYGLCAYCGIKSKWGDFKANYSKRDGFLEVINTIENIVTSNQVEGAIIRKFDSNIVARLNNISDNIHTEVTGKDGEEFKFPFLTEQDIQKVIELNKKQNG